MEEYEEVPTKYDEDFTVNDAMFFISIAVLGCVIIGYLFKVIRKTFKNVHLKIGDKIELGVETKEEK